MTGFDPVTIINKLCRVKVCMYSGFKTLVFFISNIYFFYSIQLEHTSSILEKYSN